MNVEVLRTFLEVVESGSLIAAAERLHVTQSTVTARINSLEAEVGQKLLHRNRSGAALTSAGFKFQRYAEVMVQIWRQARLDVSLPKGFVGVCNLGFDLDLWRGVGAGLVSGIRHHAPGVALAAWPGEQRMLDRWLATGLIDVALCHSPQARAPLSARVLFDDELVLVRSGRGAEGNGDYIYVDHGDEFRRAHAVAFPTRETAAITFGGSDWAFDHLLAAGGSGYLPARYLGEPRAAGRLERDEAAPVFTRRVYLVENATTTRAWPWWEAEVERLRGVLMGGDGPQRGAGRA
ncbi:MAG: LysR family transcriptional regulator [Hyphomicrobiaceae bacterium]